MDDLGDNLVRIATEFVKAGAILPVVAGGCIHFVIGLIEIGSDLSRSGPFYWLCFVLAAALGAIGCVALAVFVLIQWREHRRPPGT